MIVVLPNHLLPQELVNGLGVQDILDRSYNLNDVAVINRELAELAAWDDFPVYFDGYTSIELKVFNQTGESIDIIKIGLFSVNSNQHVTGQKPSITSGKIDNCVFLGDVAFQVGSTRLDDIQRMFVNLVHLFVIIIRIMMEQIELFNPGRNRGINRVYIA